MSITFDLLQLRHFSLLLKWLEMPHVKAWWDRDVKWTPELIEEKYGSYVDGYKLEGGARKPIHAYIVLVDGLEVGYIQYYNAHDFLRDESIDDLPQSLAASDIFMGEVDYIGKGSGSKILQLFCYNYIFKEFKHCLVDPDASNLAAIRAYEKAGFVEAKRVGDVVLMVSKRNSSLCFNISKKLESPSLEKEARRQSLLVSESRVLDLENDLWQVNSDQTGWSSSAK